MCRIRYYVLGFVVGGSLSSNLWAGVGERLESWKYFVERRTTVEDKVGKKSEVHIDRAFVHYGSGAKQAGGQIKSVPQVVYVDEDGNRLAEAVYYGSAIVPADSEELGLLSRSPGDPGSDPNLPGPIEILPTSFSVLPVSAEEEVRKGLSWNSTLHVFYGESADFPFPVRINHEVKRYKRKQGRKCAEIKYTIAGGLNMADHPEWFTQEELRENRGEISVKGNGTAYYEPVEGIVVEKEQTISLRIFGEKLRQLDDGSVGWVSVQDEEKTVKILVSLETEEGAGGLLLAGTYIVIAGVVGVFVLAFVLLRKRQTGRPGE
jgi:hypothetical protein